MKEAILAGGCFWCMVKPFDRYEGVKSVVSGYTGGRLENPSYEDVKSGKSGHVEAIKITYDETVISYETFLDVYWRVIDPTDEGGQFIDRGDSYKSAIFYTDELQKQLAEKSKQDLIASQVFDKEIVTQILPATTFYEAEDYHQDYYKKNPDAYKAEYESSGRGEFLATIWK